MAEMWHAFRCQRGAREAQQERGGGIAGEIGGEGGLAEGPVIGGGIPQQPADVAAELQGVPAVDPTEVIHRLVSAAVIQVGGSGAVSHAQVAVNVEHWEAFLVGPQRPAAGSAHQHSHDAQRLDGEIRVGARAELRDIGLIPTYAYLVQQVGAEGVDILHRQAAVGISAVVTEVRVEIDEGKVAARAHIVEEDLVVRAEILVDAHQALVGIESAALHAGKVHRAGVCSAAAYS